ncbi:MAG: ExbD/TolR family protein [Candidatus Baltobacteraceae bacterium]
MRLHFHDSRNASRRGSDGRNQHYAFHGRSAPPGFQRAFNPCNTCKAPVHTTARTELTITRSGKMFVGALQVDSHSVYALLGKAAAGQPNAKLSIIADTRAPYGVVLRALDAAKEAGRAWRQQRRQLD